MHFLHLEDKNNNNYILQTHKLKKTESIAKSQNEYHCVYAFPLIHLLLISEINQACS